MDENQQGFKLPATPFLGELNTERLFEEPSNTELLKKLELPVLNNLTDFSKLLQLSEEKIAALCNDQKINTSDFYVRFKIPKRRGGHRKIATPKPDLRKAQLIINERILKNLTVNTSARAYRKHFSIVDNAKYHVGAKTLIRIDLKDFFPSIRFERIHEFFQSLGYSSGVATVLALLTTDRERDPVKTLAGDLSVAGKSRGLPQGACTSPKLANLISFKLDTRLFFYAHKYKEQRWRYTRYADDLIFSCSENVKDASKFITGVQKIIRSEDFYINFKKTSVRRGSSDRMMVTGLVVGEKSVRLSQRDVKRMRAFFHRCETLGIEEVSRQIEGDAEAIALGYISYMHMVQPELASKYRQKYPWLAVGKFKVAPNPQHSDVKTLSSISSIPWEERNCIR